MHVDGATSGVSPDRRSVLIAMAGSLLWLGTDAIGAEPVRVAGVAGSSVGGEVPGHHRLIAQSEPALLDLCAIPLDQGGPHAAVVQGSDDPLGRFKIVASGRAGGKAVCVRPIRRGGKCVALSSDLPPMSEFATCRRVAPDHLRQALAAGVLDAAVVSEAMARTLKMQGLVGDPEGVVAPALRPSRLMVDAVWYSRCPNEVERLKSAFDVSVR
ncbi:hypothetical protein [Methylobacterium sp. AMS5]|uniref:hypothetical protein n=1 Tax=Methylobacterium sp. AMS5 TaxID=925818 RepID=UPI00074F9FB5|nr:hypothetical protein [Methylobacterium sp. AMS5]AMB44403.1 hypothetical protein Y590_05800 [Methylobacterium sp. AMS5]